MEPPRPQNDSLTPSQRQAIAARGNVLIMAGAGTGKTKTLVARCLDCLDRERASLDELLIVTFTEAAAAELRQRLRRELETQSAHAPGDDHWLRQLALFDLAHIGTLHGFCLQLIREHFYELGLDPQLVILDEGEARQRASETLEEQFHSHYEGNDDFSRACHSLIQTSGGNRDENIRQLILRLHHFSQTRPDAAGWLAEQTKSFSNAEPTNWQCWLLAAVADWHSEWLPTLENLKSGNEKAVELAGIFARQPKEITRATAAGFLQQIAAADGNWPAKRKTALRKPLENLFAEARFLSSLAVVKNGNDPLVEDWNWIRQPMVTLLQLAQEFATQFAEAKQNDGVLDFHDLEQFALKLLWDFSTNQPTTTARNWRDKLKFIFVDEYQDINAAQDKIIAALARDGADANRFLVGDVKQSIYRFRLADPKIFRDYAQHWHGNAGKTIPLAENFRSRECLLDFVNSVFRLVMRADIGGVTYDQDAELKFGSPETRRSLSTSEDAAPRVEMWLRRKTGRNATTDDEGEALADLDEAQKEARLVALRLKKLITDDSGASGLVIWDDRTKAFRTPGWRDVAILLRSPRGKSEIFAKEFERAGVPLAVAPGRFYESAEILDLLSLLQLLDNPLQDVPCIAVLRSPLVGLSLDELAEIRLGLKDGHFWTALVRSAECGVRGSEKASIFLERFSRWRKLAKQAALSECLEAMLAETLYADWLRAQPRGGQRAANVASLLHLAQQFDQYQRQGLFRFLKFIEAEQAAEVEPEVSAAATENVVRLMSIHQSKGLEFPIVVLADLAKSFNEQDLRSDIIFDDTFGLCPKVKPPTSGRRYPSLPHWLAQRRQRRELRGEELRLLYVALTRARDNLILTASLTEKNWEEVWTQPAPVTSPQIAHGKSFADWLALWFRNQTAKSGGSGAEAGEFADLRWQLVADEDLSSAGDEAGTTDHLAALGGDDSNNSAVPDPVAANQVRTKLEWNYPFGPATVQKAKSSVTALRREAEAADTEAEPIFLPQQLSLQKLSHGKLSAAASGAAHHKFLQHVALEKTTDLATEVERLGQQNFLSADELAVLDLPALADFWNSDLGKNIRANVAQVRRELPFTARFSPAELAEIIGHESVTGLENEFVVVQGVADLIVLLPEEVWLVDFKTDAVSPATLPEKIKTYAPQVKLYAAALAKIFNRQVTLRALHFLAMRRTETI